MMNKSLENVIRKAAYKGIEPLRRRYTAMNSNSSNTTANPNHTVRYRNNGAVTQSSIDEPSKRQMQNQTLDQRYKGKMNQTDKTLRNQSSTTNDSNQVVSKVTSQ